MTMSERPEVTGILYEPYLDWCAAEGLPVVEDFCVDLHKVETVPWARTGARGAFVHLKGRGDFIAINLHELPPGGQTAPQRHLFEEVFLVVEGHGSAVIEHGDGARQSFEWGPNSLFAVPLNARYQLFNGSGSAPARLASTNDLPLKMNLLHDADFIFATDWRFADREGPDASYYEGGGALVKAQRKRKMWETNFVADVNAFKLQDWGERGAGSANIVFCLADGNIHAHCSEMSVGTYKKAHRHGPDFHVFIVSGSGHSLFWYDGEKDFIRLDWGHGSVFAPTEMIYHQHFNTSAEPVRYVATAMGSTRYPLTAEKKAIKMGVDVNVDDGGCQIEYEDQDPRIHAIYLEELARNGVECRMGEFMDESVLTKGAAE
jgi:mannose-6-phosphate isomerase-like protein (cupin superfamily)